MSNKNVYLGANGYYLDQITDARTNGAALPNSQSKSEQSVPEWL